MVTRGPIIAIGIIAALLLASPFALGMLAESNFRDQIDRMNDNLYLSFELTSYESGWFGSRVEVEVAPSELYSSMLSADGGALDGIIDQIRAPFVVELGHGPVLTLNGFGIGSYAVRARLDPESDWVQAAIATLDVPYLIELRGQAGFMSGFDFEGDVPPFEITDDDDSLSFSGLDYSGHTNGTDLSFEAAAGSVIVQSALLSFTLQELGTRGEYELRPGSVSLGEGEISVERITALNPLLGTSEFVDATGLRVAAGSRLNAANNYDMNALYEAASVTAFESPELSDMALGINLMNLSSSAYADLMEMFEGMTTAPDPMVIGFQMMPIFNEFVSAGPSISLDPVRFGMDGGTLEASLLLEVVPSALPSGQVMGLMMDPSAMLSAFTGSFELNASKPLLQDLVALGLRDQMGPQLAGLTEDEIETMMQQQAEQTLGLLVAQGMLDDDGSSYSSVIDYRDGTATVNGNPIPLEGLGLF